MVNNKYDKKKYEKDFPDEGYFNWKMVRIKTPECIYYDGKRIIGVVLHDGNFMVNGMLFLASQFEIVDEDPLNLKDRKDEICSKCGCDKINIFMSNDNKIKSMECDNCSNTWSYKNE